MSDTSRPVDRRTLGSAARAAARRNGAKELVVLHGQDAARRLEAELRVAVVDVLADETHDRATRGRPAMTPMDQRRLAEATIVRLLGEHMKASAGRGERLLSQEEEQQIRDRVIASVFSRLPVLEQLLGRSDLTDITFDGPDDARVRTIDDREERIEPLFASDREMVALVRALARKGGQMVTGEDLFAATDAGGIEQEFSETRPYVDLRLSPSGARFAAVGPWVTTNGTHIAIRLHPLADVDQQDLVEDWRMYDAGLASFLGASARAGLRILISGRPSAGKSTLLRALAHELDPSWRIIQIEQNPELGLERDRARHNVVVALVERPANMEGVGAVTLDDHVRRACQRHLPDCIVVGEVRGAEVIALLKAMSMDVPGMCTMHADSASNVFDRLVYYAKEADSALAPDYVMRAAAAGLDLIVHLGRARDDHRRAVVEVLHVGHFDESTQRPVTDQWFVPGSDGVATKNPKAPLPVDVIELLSDHGYDPYLHGGGRRW